MKSRICFALVGMAALAACKGTGNPYNNSDGAAGLTANNSAFRGGATTPSVGNAVTNTGTGVTGGNGAQTVTPQGYANSGTGRPGGNPANSGRTTAAPGAGGAGSPPTGQP